MRKLKKELWPYVVTINTPNDSNLDDMEEWLKETVGVHKELWNTVYKFRKTDFYFKKESQLSFFLLRWG